MLVPIIWALVGFAFGGLVVATLYADSYTRGVRDTLVAVNAKRLTEPLPRYEP